MSEAESGRHLGHQMERQPDKENPRWTVERCALGCGYEVETLRENAHVQHFFVCDAPFGRPVSHAEAMGRA